MNLTSGNIGGPVQALATGVASQQPAEMLIRRTATHCRWLTTPVARRHGQSLQLYAYAYASCEASDSRFIHCSYWPGGVQVPFSSSARQPSMKVAHFCRHLSHSSSGRKAAEPRQTSFRCRKKVHSAAKVGTSLFAAAAAESGRGGS